MRTRKKSILDGIDREILRALYNKRPLVSRQIAKHVGLTDSAIFPRLNKLQSKGIIKVTKKFKMRIFERKFNDRKIKIRSPQSIFWDLNIKQE